MEGRRLKYALLICGWVGCFFIPTTPAKWSVAIADGLPLGG
jgi:hypothetical protein